MRAGHVTDAHLIPYVRDQDRSTAFYEAALGRSPHLRVPDRTAFRVGGAVLGPMPEDGIRQLLGPALPDPAQANGYPRAELYLVVEDPAVPRAGAWRGRVSSVLCPPVRGDRSLATASTRTGQLLTFTV